MRPFLWFSIVAMSAVCSASAQESQTLNIAGISIEVPDQYNVEISEHERLELPVLKLGHGPSDDEIALLIASGELSAKDAELFEEDSNVFPVRTMQVTVVDIPEQSISDNLTSMEQNQEVYERFDTGFVGRWGKNSFCHIHQAASAQSCINTTGALIAVHTKIIGQRLVLVEALDFAEFIKIEQDELWGAEFEDLSSSDRLELLEDVSLMSQSLEILASAKIDN